MIPYSILIDEQLGNGTPKEQYENLMKMKTALTECLEVLEELKTLTGGPAGKAKSDALISATIAKTNKTT